MQLHARAGREEQPQVDGLHRQLARGVGEGDDAPAFGAVIADNRPASPVNAAEEEGECSSTGGPGGKRLAMSSDAIWYLHAGLAS